MNKKLLFVLIAITLVILSLFVFGGKQEIKNYPPKSGSIVAFGDSLVEGVGATPGSDFVSLLSKKIGEPIINMGVSGNTTTQGLARVDEILKENPRITILLLGGNDFLRKVPRAETFGNLRTMIEKLQGSGSIVILVGVRGGLLSDNADDLFEDLAKETKSAYVSNVLSGLFADSRYMSDAIHPNDVGYARIADKIHEVLKDLLR